MASNSYVKLPKGKRETAGPPKFGRDTKAQGPIDLDLLRAKHSAKGGRDCCNCSIGCEPGRTRRELSERIMICTCVCVYMYMLADLLPAHKTGVRWGGVGMLTFIVTCTHT